MSPLRRAVAALALLPLAGLLAACAPIDDDGLLVEALEPLILEHRPRFIYTIPVFQNPSGVCLSRKPPVATTGTSTERNAITRMTTESATTIPT